MPGNLLYVLGETREELGASEYFALMGETLHDERFTGNCVPQVNASSAKQRYLQLHRAIREGLVRSCHDGSEGGLVVALAEMAFAGGLGLNVDLRKIPGASRFERDDYLLFSESASRLLVEVRPEHQEPFERLFAGTAFALIGEVAEESVLSVMGLQGREIIRENVEPLKTSWQRTL